MSSTDKSEHRKKKKETRKEKTSTKKDIIASPDHKSEPTIETLSSSPAIIAGSQYKPPTQLEGSFSWGMFPINGKITPDVLLSMAENRITISLEDQTFRVWQGTEKTPYREIDLKEAAMVIQSPKLVQPSKFLVFGLSHDDKAKNDIWILIKDEETLQHWFGVLSEVKVSAREMSQLKIKDWTKELESKTEELNNIISAVCLSVENVEKKLSKLNTEVEMIKVKINA